MGEYWAGWFDHWGRDNATTNTEQLVAEYESLLRQGYSINLYNMDTGYPAVHGRNCENGRFLAQARLADLPNQLRRMLAL